MVDLELAGTIEKIGKVTNFTDLTPKNIKTITNAIEVVNDFNSKIESYGEHIFKSLYLDTLQGWSERLNERDFKKSFYGRTPELNHRTMHEQYVFCYKTKNLYYYGLSFNSMGADRGFHTTYSFNDGKLIVTDHWESQKARFSHVPWIPQSASYHINLNESSIERF